MRSCLKASYVIGFNRAGHELWQNGEVVFSGDRIGFVGRHFPGALDGAVDYGHALICPGLIDLDALGDLDSTVLTLDNGNRLEMGRMLPEEYLERVPRETYT